MLIDYFSAFIAGLVSVFSPCILPMLPILMGTSLQAQTRSLWAMPLGLASTFTVLGLSSNILFQAFNIAPQTLQNLSAWFFIFLAFVIFFSYLQNAWLKFSGGLVDMVHQKIHTLNTEGVRGQYFLGVLLGMAWTPCIGPTLGFAMSLAAKGERLIYAAGIMFLFAWGVCLPIIALAYGIKKSKKYAHWHKKLLPYMNHIKIAFGVLLLVWGSMILLGLDKKLASFLLLYMPDIKLPF